MINKITKNSQCPLTSKLKSDFPGFFGNLFILDVPESWFPLVYATVRALYQLSESMDNELLKKVYKIKNNYGRVRFSHIGLSTYEAQIILEVAESISSKLCTCGKNRSLSCCNKSLDMMIHNKNKNIDETFVDANNYLMHYSEISPCGFFVENHNSDKEKKYHLKIRQGKKE